VPIGGEGVIAGPYTVTWNGTSVGVFLGDEDLPSIVKRDFERPIDNTDKYGRAKVDAIHLGSAMWFQGVLLEYAKGIPVADPFGTFGSALGTIGVLKYSLAKALVLTAVAGTSAATTPATITANKTIQSADFDIKQVYGPRERVVPVKLDMYAYDVGAGAIGFKTQT
jgi:hypothetical protein